MNEVTTTILVVLALFILGATVIDVAACMLSSVWSERERAAHAAFDAENEYDEFIQQ